MSSRTEWDASLRMETLVDEVSRWPGVSVEPGRSGGRVFSLGSREVGTVTFGGRVAVTFGRSLREPLVDARWTTPDPVTPASGRTVFRVHGDADLARARSLLRLSSRCCASRISTTRWRGPTRPPAGRPSRRWTSRPTSTPSRRRGWSANA